MTDGAALIDLGWSSGRQERFYSRFSGDLLPARVIRCDRGSSLVAMSAGIVRAKPSIRLLNASASAAELPAVGDWVGVLAPEGLDVPLIEAVLERDNIITRGDPGKTSENQALAANVDTIFVVHPIANEPNLRRIERELSLAWESKAQPVVVLTKMDLSTDPEGARLAVASIALNVDILLVNALDTDSVQHLLDHISGLRTAVLIGPSGAGKSTLINALLGSERQATREVRESDSRGRHTTVARELIVIPGYGVIIDTPGLRALGLTGSAAGIASTFPDIEELAAECRFRDCRHEDEPGCAVHEAIEAGTLPVERLDSYHKLIRESEVAAMKTDLRLRAEEQRKWKSISKAVREYYRITGRR